MRIVFISTNLLGRALLVRLIAAGCDVVGVLCKEESRYNADFAPLADIAMAADIPVHLTRRLKDPDSRAWIAARRPDVIFCFGWSELLDADLLHAAPRGVVGFHPTLLPRHRGRHPIIWALALGLSETGSSFFFMDEGADAGPLLSQRRISISEDMDAGALYQAIQAAAEEQVLEVAAGLAAGTLTGLPQDHALATAWRKRSAIDGRIDWRMPARGIRNLVRALAHPYFGATALAPEGDFIIWQVADGGIAPADCEPGRILSVAWGVPTIKCGDGTIALVRHERRDPFSVGECL
jgi:methionyl-tRNA formyltransferase